MTSEEAQALAEILRRHFRLIADCEAFMAILQSYAALGAVPTDWQERLHRLRRTPAYRAAAESAESKIRAIEQAPTDIAWIGLFRTLREGKPPN